GELELDNAVWTVPAGRMKAGKAHRVALSGTAVELLQRLRPQGARPDGLVFPGEKPGQPLSDMSLTAVLRRMNEQAAGKRLPWRDTVQDRPITVHGFPSTFRI